jgi:hypothetical protein
MKFEKRANTEMSSINEWQAGKYVIAELAFAFGQHRIQIWYYFHGLDSPYPDVVPPNF